MRDICQYRIREGDDSCGGNPIHGKRSSCGGIDNRAHASKVAHAHGVRRERRSDGNPLENAAAFVIAKDEGFVPPDRPTQAYPKLVLAEVRFRGVKEVSCVQDIVAKIFVNDAMEVIRTRLRGNIDLCSADTSELSRVIAGVDLEFLDGINGRRYD